MMWQLILARWKPIAIGVGVLLVVLLLVFSARSCRSPAEPDTREEDKARLEAEINNLRGENTQLRAENAKARERVAALEAKEEAQTAIIDQAGGRIEQKQEELKKIEEQLKHETEIINAPADACVRCRALSADLVSQRVISKPLACRDECAGR